MFNISRAVIALFFHDTFQYAQQALKYGVIEYLLKPCSQKEMEEALLRACQAVDRQRKKVLYLYEERRQRIKSLVDSFNALRESEADAEQLEKQTEYFVNFSVIAVEPEPLIPAGYEIAYDQFRLPVEAERNTYKANGPALQTQTQGDELTVSSSKVNFVFNKKSGLVTSYKVDGTEYFKDGFGIQPNFWRAPNDNDYGNGAPKRLHVWKQSSKDFHVTDTKVSTEDKAVLLQATYLLAAGNLYVVTYKIYPSGIVHVNAKFTSTDMQAAETEVSEATRMATFTPGSDAARKAASKLEVPRIGVRFRLPAQMNNVQYFGRGPEENYIDRNHGTMVGIYQTTADKMYFNYVRPQENGHHTDTRWLNLSPDKGNGLVIVADSLIGFNALRNSVEDFDSEEALPRI